MAQLVDELASHVSRNQGFISFFRTYYSPTVTALPRQAVLRRHNATVAGSDNEVPEPHQPADSSAPVMNPPASAPRRPDLTAPGDELEAICVPAMRKELTVPRRLAHSVELMSFSRRTDELVTLKRQRTRPSLHVLQPGLLVFHSTYSGSASTAPCTSLNKRLETSSCT